jgi:hypothetical protein
MRYLGLEKRRQKMLELRNQLRAQYIFAKRTIVLTPPRSLARSQKLGACAVMEKWYTHHAYGPPSPRTAMDQRARFSQADKSPFLHHDVGPLYRRRRTDRHRAHTPPALSARSCHCVYHPKSPLLDKTTVYIDRRRRT